MLIGFKTSIYLYQAHRLTTMESLYSLGRRDTLCAYVSHGGYILSRTATSAILAAIDMAHIEVDKSSLIPSSDNRTCQRLADWWNK